MRTGRVSVPTEAMEQRQIFEWAAYMESRHPELKLLHHCPNGGTRDPREAHNLKLQGVKAGVPDIFLPVARHGYHGLFIELKRVKGGTVSEAQREWLDALGAQGYKAIVCKGAGEAIDEISEYLRGE